MRGHNKTSFGFSLVEVVLALGIVSFSVLATIGLLSVANETNKRSRDEAFAAQLAANEFEKLRSLSAANFPTATYSRYYDGSLTEVPQASAVYELRIIPSMHYPANALPANQSKILFTTLMNIPLP